MITELLGIYLFIGWRKKGRGSKPRLSKREEVFPECV